MTNPHNVDKLLGDDKIVGLYVTVDSVKDLGITVNISSTLETLLHSHMLEQARRNRVCKGYIYTPNISLLKYVPRKRNNKVLQVNGNNAWRV